MSKDKRYIEIIPTLTVTNKINSSDKVVWVGDVRFKLKHNMKYNFWAATWLPKKSELTKVGLTLAEFEEINRFVDSLNYLGENRMSATKKEYLIEDVKTYLENTKGILKFSKYQEVYTFEPLSRLEEK